VVVHQHRPGIDPAGDAERPFPVPLCIAQEEIFDPVATVTVTVFDTEDEAVPIANETP
jgi:hypothetical protein